VACPKHKLDNGSQWPETGPFNFKIPGDLENFFSSTMGNGQMFPTLKLLSILCVCVCVCVFLGLCSWHVEVPRLRVELEVWKLGHSHSNVRSEPCLQSTTQVIVIPDP